MRSCIYKIINLNNGKFYLGSTYNIEKRFRDHLYNLKCNNHHSIYLQNAYNLYGKDSFIFHIIEYCDPEKLLEFEQIYLNNLSCDYNISKNARSPMTGRIHSIETRSKMSGRKQSEYNKRIFRIANTSGTNSRVYCINNNKTYECQTDAASELNIEQGQISEVCLGKRESARGYFFRFVDQETKLIGRIGTRKRRVVDHNGVYYDSIVEACIVLKLNKNSVRNILKRKNVYERDGIELRYITNETYFSNFKLRYRQC